MDVVFIRREFLRSNISKAVLLWTLLITDIASQTSFAQVSDWVSSGYQFLVPWSWKPAPNESDNTRSSSPVSSEDNIHDSSDTEQHKPQTTSSDMNSNSVGPSTEDDGAVKQRKRTGYLHSADESS